MAQTRSYSNDPYDLQKKLRGGVNDTPTSALQARLNNMQAPKPMAIEAPNTQAPNQALKDPGQVYQAKENAAALPEYDYLRRKTTEQSTQANATAQDALKRRFAAMGNLNSGSYIKQAQIQDESSDVSRQNALQDIGFQEAQSKRELDTQEQQKVFQS